jgi:hypothetical protein
LGGVTGEKGNKKNELYASVYCSRGFTKAISRFSFGGGGESKYPIVVE